MAIIVEGGVVSLVAAPKVKAPVNSITFPNAVRVDGKVPIGAIGVLLLKNVPDHQNFENGSALNYEDSNNNNNAVLTVTGVVGPTKYNVTRTA